MEPSEERDLVQPVEYECETTFDYVSEINQSLKDNPLLKNIIKINLKHPPGLVGEVTEWINDQCLYPREELAVAASLYLISVLGGLRYVDDLSHVTPNMLFFCVAGSASGKDAIYSAVAQILSQTGYGETISGDIKSEQDIHKSFLEHQMVNYYVDEIGEFLGKVKSASRTGSSSAHYMHGILAGMMKIFTKADERLFLNKDAVRAWKKEATTKIKELRKVISLEESESHENSEEITKAQTLINRLENRMDIYTKEGIQKPFLSLMSFTTPETFESHVNQENVEKGLIGRAVIINEKNTNPFDKDNFQKRPMSPQMNNALVNLGNIEKYTSPDGRIENLNERELIKSTPEALNKLKIIRRFIIRELAELHKKNTGLEAIVRRSAEMVQKVSLILAIPTGQRTVSDVDWAFAFVWRDLMTKIKMITATESGESGIEARVYNYLEKKSDIFTAQQLAKRMKLKQDEVKIALESLIKKKLVTYQVAINRRNGKQSVKYSAS